MIEYRKGNLLDVTSGIIIHGCNAQGVMGSGVALSIKQKYPQVYEDYKHSGRYLGQSIRTWVSDDLLVISAITQQNYGRDGRRYVNYAAIAKVFDEAISVASAYDHVLHFPKIGAGLGGGDWRIIEQIIDDCDSTEKVKKICWEL